MVTLWIGGAFLIFLMARVLGADVSFSQSVGVIGYCLLPVVCVAILLLFISRFQWVLKVRENGIEGL